jgi:excisionase family DNA binding protein
MSHQKVTSKFPTAERSALSSRQQDPHHPNKPPRERRPFLLPSPPKPRKAKLTSDTQWRRSARPSRGVTETAEELSVSLDTQTHPGDDSDAKAAGFRDVRGRRYTGIGVPKAYRIKTIAEALDVSPRTIRRWIATRKLIAHQIDGVVRITEADFRTFLAVYRCT